MVEVTKVLRAAEDAFEIRWEEQILEIGAPVKREHFVGTIAIVFGSPTTTTKVGKSPLGLYVDRFTCGGIRLGMRADDSDSSFQ